jgi:hypothetical protein
MTVNELMSDLKKYSKDSEILFDYVIDGEYATPDLDTDYSRQSCAINGIYADGKCIHLFFDKIEYDNEMK